MTTEESINEIAYNDELSKIYYEEIKSLFSDKPKNIFDVMQEHKGCWESVPVAMAMNCLEEQGKIVESHRVGCYFQDRYFVARKPVNLREFL